MALQLYLELQNPQFHLHFVNIDISITHKHLHLKSSVPIDDTIYEGRVSHFFIYPLIPVLPLGGPMSHVYFKKSPCQMSPSKNPCL